MKKILSYCLALTIVLFNLGALNAATSVNLPISASVSASTPEITVVLRQIDDGDLDHDPWTGSTPVSSMAFGPLTHILPSTQTDAGIWFARSFFCAIIFTQPFGKPYNINSSSAGLTGPAPFPAPAFVLTPAYAAKDKFDTDGDGIGDKEQGPMPSGASLGNNGNPSSAVGVNKLVYSSETGTALGRIIQTYYSIPPDGPGGVDPYPGWSGVPLGQAAGNYSGTVTLTITLK